MSKLEDSFELKIPDQMALLALSLIGPAWTTICWNGITLVFLPGAEGWATLQFCDSEYLLGCGYIQFSARFIPTYLSTGQELLGLQPRTQQSYAQLLSVVNQPGLQLGTLLA